MRNGRGQPARERDEGGVGGQRVSVYAWYVLGVLVLVYTLNFIDRQILSILAEDIKADLHIDDAQLGFLYGTAFAIFYTIFGIPLGRLADRWHRGRLLALGLAAWSAMTALSGLSTSYAQLAVARIGVGIGEASASPAAFSLLAGYFPDRRRALAMSIYSAGVYLGMGLSLPLGGVISDSWDAAYSTGAAPLGFRGWQVAFLAVGLPGILLAVWVWSLREPVRFQGDHQGRETSATPWRAFAADLASIMPPFTIWVASRRPGALPWNLAAASAICIVVAALVLATGDYEQWIGYGIGLYAVFSWAQALKHEDRPTFALIWGRSAVPLALAGFGMLAIVTYSFGFWAAPYAIRNFDLSASSAGLVIGIPGAAAAAAGVIVGGRLSDAWKQRDPRGRVFTCMLAAFSAPLMVIMFSTSNFTTYALLSAAVFFFANLWAGSAVATYQDLVLPRMYGTVGAIYLLGSTMVGLAIGPYASGKLAAISGTLQAGVLSISLAPVLALVMLWLLSRRIKGAEDSKWEVARLAGEPLPENNLAA